MRLLSSGRRLQAGNRRQLFKKYAGRVMVSYPIRTRAIPNAKIKTDRVDVGALAQLAAVALQIRGTLCSTVAREHLSIRVDPATKQDLEREARRRGTPTTTLAESLLREGIRAAAHPGVTFRDGPAGRRAGLIGGPDVWEVVRVWLDEGKRVEGTAGTLRLPAAMVEAALGYYAEYRDEIEEWIERNDALMAEAEAAWRRRQALGAS